MIYLFTTHKNLLDIKGKEPVFVKFQDGCSSAGDLFCFSYSWFIPQQLLVPLHAGALQGADFLRPVFTFESAKTCEWPQDWEKLIPEPLLVS